MMPRGMMQISPGVISMTPNSVRKRRPPCCATTNSSPSASKKCSRVIDWVMNRRCTAMPVIASASPRGRHRAQTGDEGPLVTRDRHRAPAALDEHLRAVLALGSGANIPAVDPRKSADVAHGRADTVEPRALVGRLWRSEGRAGELLGIKSVGDLLRRVAADRQRARQRVGLEAVAEAGHVSAGRYSAVPRQSS